MRKSILISVLIITLITSFVFGAAEREYPERDITTVVVWGAGGGTDVINRIIMAEMSEILGVNINVINVTGGVAGSVGMNDAFNRPKDGYVLAGMSESNVTSAVMGGFNNRVDVWDWFIVGGSPDVVSVGANSPYNTLDELIDAAKANPGSIRAGASGAGSIHHLNLLAFENGTDTDFNFIPYDGSAPAQNAALTGEVSIIITSIAEQAQLIRGGQLKPLAMLEPEAFTVDGLTIPSSFTNYPELAQYLPLRQSIGFAIAKEAPQYAKDKISEAFKQAMETQAVKDFGKNNFYILAGLYGDEANTLMNNLESSFAWTLHELGSARVNPDSLNIPKP